MAWKRQRIQDHFVILCQELDVDRIVPILRAERMLTMDEMEQLTNQYFTTQTRRQKLLLIVPHKGRDHFEKFCECLVWSGQEELAAKIGVPVSNIPPSPHPPAPTPGAQQQEDFKRMLHTLHMLSDGMGRLPYPQAPPVPRPLPYHAAAAAAAAVAAVAGSSTTSTIRPTTSTSHTLTAPPLPPPPPAPSAATTSSSAVPHPIQATGDSDNSYTYTASGEPPNLSGAPNYQLRVPSTRPPNEGGSGAKRKVFILYCNDEQMRGGDFFKSVEDLADFLTRVCGQGTEIICDFYLKGNAGNWTRWTERQIRISDWVLLVCSKTLKEMLDRRNPHRNPERPVQMKVGHFDAETVYNLIQTPKFIPVFLNHQEREGLTDLFREPYHSWVPAQLLGSKRYWLDIPGVHKDVSETSTEEEYERELKRVLTSGTYPRSVEPLTQLLRALQETPDRERPTPYPTPIVPPIEPTTATQLDPALHNPELKFSTSELLTIASRIPQDWQTLGIKLGLTYHVLEDIRTRNIFDVKQAILEMLALWRREKKDQATRTALRYALLAIRYSRLAEEIFNRD